MEHFDNDLKKKKKDWHRTHNYGISSPSMKEGKDLT